MVKRLRVKAVFAAVYIAIEPSENLETLFGDKGNEPAVDNFNFRTEYRLDDLSTEEKSGPGITAVVWAKKFREEMKQKYRKIPRSQRPPAVQSVRESKILDVSTLHLKICLHATRLFMYFKILFFI